MFHKYNSFDKPVKLLIFWPTVSKFTVNNDVHIPLHYTLEKKGTGDPPVVGWLREPSTGSRYTYYIQLVNSN